MHHNPSDLGSFSDPDLDHPKGTHLINFSIRELYFRLNVPVYYMISLNFGPEWNGTFLLTENRFENKPRSIHDFSK